MSLYLRVLPYLLMIPFHLFERSPIWVMHEVESVAPGCPMSHYHIALIILKHQMQIELLLVLLAVVIPDQMMTESWYGDSFFIEITWLGRGEHFARFFLSSLGENTRVTSKFISVVDISQVGEENLKDLFRVL